MCLFASCRPSLVTSSFRSFAQFSVVLFVFLLLSFESSWCILDISPLSDTCLANILSHSVACLFILSVIPFT